MKVLLNLSWIDIPILMQGQKAKNVTDQVAALEGLRKQHDLLKKMLKQQEEVSCYDLFYFSLDF